MLAIFREVSNEIYDCSSHIVGFITICMNGAQNTAKSVDRKTLAKFWNENRIIIDLISTDLAIISKSGFNRQDLC